MVFMYFMKHLDKFQYLFVVKINSVAVQRKSILYYNSSSKSFLSCLRYALEFHDFVLITQYGVTGHNITKLESVHEFHK